MKNKLILFSHHYVNDEIKKRYFNLTNLNTNWDVKPIGFENYNLLPDSIIVNKDKYPTNNLLKDYTILKNSDWCDPDLYLYEAYLQFPDYESYFLYEYDTICNVSVDNFFDTNLDFFGNNIITSYELSRCWTENYRKLNPNNIYVSNLYTYGQSTCIYFKNDILKKCVNEVIKNKHLYNEMLSEIRGGTLAKKFTDLKKGRKDIEKYISWHQSLINVDLTKEYFYHPIKCI